MKESPYEEHLRQVAFDYMQRCRYPTTSRDYQAAKTSMCFSNCGFPNHFVSSSCGSTNSSLLALLKTLSYLLKRAFPRPRKPRENPRRRRKSSKEANLPRTPPRTQRSSLARLAGRAPPPPPPPRTRTCLDEPRMSSASNSTGRLERALLAAATANPAERASCLPVLLCKAVSEVSRRRGKKGQRTLFFLRI